MVDAIINFYTITTRHVCITTTLKNENRLDDTQQLRKIAGKL